MAKQEVKTYRLKDGVGALHVAGLVLEGDATVQLAPHVAAKHPELEEVKASSGKTLKKTSGGDA